MAYELKGTLVKLMDRQDFPSGFFKRDFVVQTQEQYPQVVKFTLVKEKVEMIDAFQEGQNLTVSFDVRGREYNGNYYVDLQAWKVEAADGAPAPARPAKPQATAASLPDVTPLAPAASDDVDDLPF
jgi:hypothetical protein